MDETTTFKLDRDRSAGYPWWAAHCTGCGYGMAIIHVDWNYCPQCGRKIVWEDD